MTIRAPNPRDRGEDIKLTAHQLLDELQQKKESEAEGFTRNALSTNEQHDWPGNARELQNPIEQAAPSAGEELVTPADPGLDEPDASAGPVTLRQAKDNAEKTAISAALERNRYNLTHAARELEVSRMTLYRLMQKHGIPNLSSLKQASPHRSP